MRIGFPPALYSTSPPLCLSSFSGFPLQRGPVNYWDRQQGAGGKRRSSTVAMVRSSTPGHLERALDGSLLGRRIPMKHRQTNKKHVFLGRIYAGGPLVSYTYDIVSNCQQPDISSSISLASAPSAVTFVGRPTTCMTITGTLRGQLTLSLHKAPECIGQSAVRNSRATARFWWV